MSQCICGCRYEVRPHFLLMLNRKFHTSQISNCEEFVPITHSARKNGTCTSHIPYQYLHFVKNTHVGKCHRAYMRIPLIDKIAPPSCYILHWIPILHSFVTYMYLLTSVTIKSHFSHQTNLMF